MDFRAKIRVIIKTLIENIHERRKLILALSCAVVFITTYILILPAFTLDKQEAAEQGGIDVPAAEQIVDADTDLPNRNPMPVFQAWEEVCLSDFIFLPESMKVFL